MPEDVKEHIFGYEILFKYFFFIWTNKEVPRLQQKLIFVFVFILAVPIVS
jgi:hypothetical protein